jgi:hypothetical protein
MLRFRRFIPFGALLLAGLASPDARAIDLCSKAILNWFEGPAEVGESIVVRSSNREHDDPASEYAPPDYNGIKRLRTLEMMGGRNPDVFPIARGEALRMLQETQGSGVGSGFDFDGKFFELFVLDFVEEGRPGFGRRSLVLKNSSITTELFPLWELSGENLYSDWTSDATDIRIWGAASKVSDSLVLRVHGSSKQLNERSAAGHPVPGVEPTFNRYYRIPLERLRSMSFGGREE